jgi:hypothetical protein
LVQVFQWQNPAVNTFISEVNVVIYVLVMPAITTALLCIIDINVICPHPLNYEETILVTVFLFPVLSNTVAN